MKESSHFEELLDGLLWDTSLDQRVHGDILGVTGDHRQVVGTWAQAIAEVSRVLGGIGDGSGGRGDGGELLSDCGAIEGWGVGRGLGWHTGDVWVFTGGNIKLTRVGGIGGTTRYDGTIEV